MPFSLSLIHNNKNNSALPQKSPPSISLPLEDDYDSADDSDQPLHNDHSVYASASTSYRRSSDAGLLLPVHDPARLSHSSSAASSPIPSRAGSPAPQQSFFTSAPSSSCTSDADSEPTSPLLPRNRRVRWWNDDAHRWWLAPRDNRRKRRRRDRWHSSRAIRRFIRILLRHPLFPTQPTSILVSLLILTIFAILLTLLLIHVLNPDKEPLPWRAYCSIPSASTAPPSLSATSYSPAYPFNSLAPADISSLSTILPNSHFPPPHLDDYPPAGLFLGVFSMDSAVERRMMVRSTWASHERSRNGAGEGDDGNGTSRTIVRFVLGKPRSSWEERIRLEAEMYNDMIVLPISENMNSGKTHAFFAWAAEEAWVPPLTRDYDAAHATVYSYSNVTAPSSIPPAVHDPKPVRQEWQSSLLQKPWVHPDFVVKVDDDSFVMLAELEARLRVELHTKPRFAHENITATLMQPAGVYNRRSPASTVGTTAPSPLEDPLVYWGYLVKNQFMAGELYALSWSLATWAARDPQVKGMVRGKEDKQVAKWMRIHPRAPEVRWKSERCWIYDHPKAGTVYSHGFLFPSEATRVRKSILSYFSSASSDLLGDEPVAAAPATPMPGDASSPSSWAYSSVSTFGVRYTPPLPDLTTMQAVEALVEGSEMSKLRVSVATGGSSDGTTGGLGEGSSGVVANGMTPEEAWSAREGRKARYEGSRVGGTIAVHFIKKSPWYLETALAMLMGDEQTPREAGMELEQRMRAYRAGGARRIDSDEDSSSTSNRSDTGVNTDSIADPPPSTPSSPPPPPLQVKEEEQMISVPKAHRRR